MLNLELTLGQYNVNVLIRQGNLSLDEAFLVNGFFVFR